MDKDVTVAKIVATPTLSSWSQAYNAGKLFAVLSFQKLNIEGSAVDENFLNTLGKNTLETLENEFFTLEKKTLEEIKKAVEKTCESIPSEVSISFIVGALVSNALYVFAKGEGKVRLKRGETFGTILLGTGSELKSASGFLQNGDIIILQTGQFANIISDETLSKTLDHQPVNEIAETLAPIVHEKQEGGASAILFEFKGNVTVNNDNDNLTEPIAMPAPESPIEKEDTKLKYINLFKSYLIFLKNKLPKIEKLELQRLNHTKRLTLTIAVILLLVFIGSVFFAAKKQENDKNKAVFNDIYVSAQKNYDEGQSLLGLNQNLARDSFLKAQASLLSGKDKLSKGSDEDKKVQELLGKVQTALSSSSGIKSVNATEVGTDQSALLSFERDTANALYSAADGSNIYVLTQDGVLTLRNGKNSTALKNDSLWTSPGGLGAYFGNLYILDKSAKQIFKFVSTGDGFGKANYFAKDTNPDLSKAKSITIDGSIYTLFSDGSIEKFTKGSSDTFSLTGLEKGFSNPTRIFTNADSDNLYVLDNGNSRIVVLDKTGGYKAQYQTEILKTAKDLEVKEKDKKIFILSGGKIYQIDL